ncbi:MAG: phosphopyruvate hydratase [Candidatus Babeliales bacterium]
MKITNIEAREILNSRGMPTLECTITLDGGKACVTASVPSGISVSSKEAKHLFDGGNRLGGKGVTKAISLIHDIIAPELLGSTPQLKEIDEYLCSLDSSEQKETYGANTLLAVSIASAKAQAYNEGLYVCELLSFYSDTEAMSIPYPMINVINGGMHAFQGLSIQEYMIVPLGAESFRESMEIAAEIVIQLGKLLKKSGKNCFIGQEGGYVSEFASEEEPLELISQAVTLAGCQEGVVSLALDCAATHFYDAETKLYTIHKKRMNTEELIKWYGDIAERYNIYSLEDPFAEEDEDGWQMIMNALGENLYIVGDDLFATNPSYVMRGISEGLANSALIKPDQIGTVTEAISAVEVCKTYGMATTASHRSGETEDNFIVDFAIGLSLGQLKAGGLLAGGHVDKYNHALRMEEKLTMQTF